MAYDALTIDTQVVYSNDVDLDSGLVGQLTQYKDGLVKFILSEVNLREIHKALTEKAKSTNDALSKAIKSGASNRQLDDTQLAAIKGVAEGIDKPQEHARKQLSDFIKATGAEIVPVSLVEARVAFDKYFKNDPPFSSKGKKNEFPDAFALLSLEAWAEAKGKKVLAVSKDTDWKLFAQQSDCIDVIEDLAKAMALLTDVADAMLLHAHEALKSLGESGSEADLLVESFLSHSIESENPYLDFYSSMPGELESVSLALVNYQIDGIESQTTDIDVVRVGKGSFAFRVPALITANAEAEISFSIKDSIDNDYVSVGSTSITREVEFDAFILFECSLVIDDNGNEHPNSYEIDNAEVVDVPNSIDFGYVGYSLAEDDYDFDIDSVYEEETPSQGPDF